jgi:hypothetical protein
VLHSIEGERTRSIWKARWAVEEGKVPGVVHGEDGSVQCGRCIPLRRILVVLAVEILKRGRRLLERLSFFIQ